MSFLRIMLYWDMYKNLDSITNFLISKLLLNDTQQEVIFLHNYV